VLPGPGPLLGTPVDEITVVYRWLTRPGTRLVRTSRPWGEPARGAGSWLAWADLAAEGRAGYAAAD